MFFQLRNYNFYIIAAAYKHVPMLERNPWQAVSNNIRGNQVMLEKPLEYKVGHFVLVSTDKIAGIAGSDPGKLLFSWIMLSKI
jgi:FlaA1/EpsC-like NDP-sugar epimerase